MWNIRSHSSSYYTVPSRQVHCIEFCFNNLCNIVQYPFLLKCKRNAINCMLLHFIWHITTLNYCIFCFLLIKASVWLSNMLFVNTRFPFFSRCNSRVRLCWSHFYLIILNYEKFIRRKLWGLWLFNATTYQTCRITWKEIVRI